MYYIYIHSHTAHYTLGIYCINNAIFIQKLNTCIYVHYIFNIHSEAAVHFNIYVYYTKCNILSEAVQCYTYVCTICNVHAVYWYIISNTK